MYLRYLAKNETEIQFETVKKLAYLLGVALEGPCCPRMWRMEADRLGYSQSSMNSHRCSSEDSCWCGSGGGGGVGVGVGVGFGVGVVGVVRVGIGVVVVWC